MDLVKIINYCEKTSESMHDFFDEKRNRKYQVWIAEAGTGYHMDINDMFHICRMGELDFTICPTGTIDYDPGLPARNYRHIYVLTKGRPARLYLEELGLNVSDYNGTPYVKM